VTRVVAEIEGRKVTLEVIEAIALELQRARAKYPDFHSSHEGHSLIREELEGLWDLVKADHSTRPSGDFIPGEKLAFPQPGWAGDATTYRQAMRDECVQIAAMAIRFIEDLCEEKRDG
jgi:hypothetical protein